MTLYIFRAHTLRTQDFVQLTGKLVLLLQHFSAGNHSRLQRARKVLGTYGVGARGSVVVKALRYKPAGRGFDSRWCHWNFSVT